MEEPASSKQPPSMDVGSARPRDSSNPGVPPRGAVLGAQRGNPPRAMRCAARRRACAAPRTRARCQRPEGAGVFRAGQPAAAGRMLTHKTYVGNQTPCKAAGSNNKFAQRIHRHGPGGAGGSQSQSAANLVGCQKAKVARLFFFACVRTDRCLMRPVVQGESLMMRRPERSATTATTVQYRRAVK